MRDARTLRLVPIRYYLFVPIRSDRSPALRHRGGAVGVRGSGGQRGGLAVHLLRDGGLGHDRGHLDLDRRGRVPRAASLYEREGEAVHRGELRHRTEH